MNSAEKYLENVKSEKNYQDQYYRRFSDFILEYNISNGSKVFYHKILNKLHPFEVAKKDYLYNFSSEEIKEILSTIGTKSQNMVQSTFYIISSYCNWAFERGYLYTTNPCLEINTNDFIDLKRAKTMYISREDLYKQLDECKYACGFFDKLCLILARNGIPLNIIINLENFNLDIDEDFEDPDSRVLRVNAGDKKYKFYLDEKTIELIKKAPFVNEDELIYGNKADKEIVYRDLGLLLKAGTFATRKDFIQERDINFICRKINKYNNTFFKISELILSYRIDRMLIHKNPNGEIDYEAAVQEYRDFYGSFDYSTYNLFKNQFYNITGIKIENGTLVKS